LGFFLNCTCITNDKKKKDTTTIKKVALPLKPEYVNLLLYKFVTKYKINDISSARQRQLSCVEQLFTQLYACDIKLRHQKNGEKVLK